jgi:hypothetical protein
LLLKKARFSYFKKYDKDYSVDSLINKYSMKMTPTKISWKGNLISIQPLIRLLRSFDQRNHNYLGYVLQIKGMIDEKEQEFSIGIGKAAQEKHQFKISDVVKGESHSVLDQRIEVVEYYKTSKLEIIERGDDPMINQPPWIAVPPSLEIYRKRGHRRLDIRTYESKCRQCIWGCKMPVEMTIDQWNPREKQYRTETFCYGPKSCKLYKAGPTRKVPGRKGMTWEEEDWVDEDAVSHRGVDE